MDEKFDIAKLTQQLLQTAMFHYKARPVKEDKEEYVAKYFSICLNKNINVETAKNYLPQIKTQLKRYNEFKNLNEKTLSNKIAAYYMTFCKN